ncbi:hypothetical protein NGTWS0302_29360 [Mycolicibacterium cyprinidarum]|uniref:Endonuclease/exonuclease/phosphatase domain-containing protein n=1 Tax=Mycolicibacterium cyprinidarum TaxID=2860311 RepID=A0ABQ4V352_9MYCO|nr:hypothetical protein NGTWS1702_31710 [Mycolicibacterium sp. NGTWSNA01]GJF11681.1 hypothetical protein NGTWS0302_29360 [Mycolicibacterium sp. NGTWS0302]
MVLVVLALGFSVFTLIARALPLPNNIVLFVAVGSPYVAVAVVVVLVMSAIHRRVAMALVAATIVVANVVIQVPWYYFGKPPDVGEHVDVRVLSANLRLGRADVPSFVELARGHADVITLSEMTPDWLRQFYATGIRAAFPYSVLVPAVGAGGFGLWSRFPLEVVTPLKGGSMIAARVQVPGVRIDPVVASVHITNPLAFYGRAFGKSGEAASPPPRNGWRALLTPPTSVQ